MPQIHSQLSRVDLLNKGKLCVVFEGIHVHVYVPPGCTTLWRWTCQGQRIWTGTPVWMQHWAGAAAWRPSKENENLYPVQGWTASSTEKRHTRGHAMVKRIEREGLSVTCLETCQSKQVPKHTSLKILFSSQNNFQNSYQHTEGNTLTTTKNRENNVEKLEVVTCSSN